MEPKRKIAMVATKVSFAEAEEADLEYWMSLSSTERLKELYSLKQMNWSGKNKPYPEHMEKVAEKKIKSQTDEDDF
jgi:hypothetical protein